MGTGTGRRDIGHGSIERSQPFGGFGHVVSVAHGHDPAIVDHQETGGANFDLVAGHGDDRRGRRRHAHDLDGHSLGVLAQHIIPGDAFENIAAIAVDVHPDVTLADREDLALPLSRRSPRPRHSIPPDTVHPVYYLF